ncbi:hypothetical protein BV20DRAFT_1051930 [Pilatotrama ljubarskyi]|nr:hypothetical protein BV20DRAFT_1051930 [Pilatotrama ljubarskyi]
MHRCLLGQQVRKRAILEPTSFISQQPALLKPFTTRDECRAQDPSVPRRVISLVVRPDRSVGFAQHLAFAPPMSHRWQAVSSAGNAPPQHM